MGGGWSYGTVPPLNDAVTERWGLNYLQRDRFAFDVPRWDRWFDLHNWERDRLAVQQPEIWAWYQQQTQPIYTWTPHPDVPASVAYPLDRIQAEWPGDRDFACSLSWMLALAIVEGFTDVDLFWCPMQDPEHAAFVPSVRYWMGMARGRGMTVTVHGWSLLVPEGPLYGVET